MKFNSDTKRGNVVIQGKSFTVPRPFEEKHVCSGAEAEALNQLLAENTRNNLAKRIKDAGADLNVAALQKEIDKYLEGYEFGVRRGGSADPVDRECMRIAIEAVKRAIKSQGHKLADFSAEDIRALATKAIEKEPKIRAQAKTAVAAREAIGVEALGVLA